MTGVHLPDDDAEMARGEAQKDRELGWKHQADRRPLTWERRSADYKRAYDEEWEDGA